MTDTLLQIVQRSARLLNIPVPSAVVTSTDAQVQQLWEIGNEEGEELQRRFDWQILTREWTFSAVAAASQPSAIPTDFDRFLSNSTFDRTTMRQVIGSITPQMWQAIAAYPQLNRVFLAFRMRDGEYLATPTPTAGDTIAFEYVTLNWCTAADGTPKPDFTDDTDVPLLDPRLFRLGIRWRFRKSHNLDFAQDFDTYEREVQIASAADGGPGQLDITGRTIWNSLYPNVPLGNWPG